MNLILGAGKGQWKFSKKELTQSDFFFLIEDNSGGSVKVGLETMNFGLETRESGKGLWGLHTSGQKDREEEPFQKAVRNLGLELRSWGLNRQTLETTAATQIASNGPSEIS